MNDWFQKNKIVLFIVIVLGLFLGYAYKNDLSFTKKNYVPGVVEPIKPPKVSETDWKNNFEREREN